MENVYAELIEWCKYQNLRIIKNEQAFFVNERVILKPQFIVNGKIFIDIPDEYEMTEKYLEFRKTFSISYGTIIILPKSMISELKEITKFDIQEKFNIKF